jgi:uncharacterized protein YfaS (alpha-2-macroglobulin family)
MRRERRCKHLDLKLDSKAGTQGRFQLPDNAVAGGYELRFNYKDQAYSSAFRVAEYIKPHFEISLNLAKQDYRTGERSRAAWCCCTRTANRWPMPN